MVNAPMHHAWVDAGGTRKESNLHAKGNWVTASRGDHATVTFRAVFFPLRSQKRRRPPWGSQGGLEACGFAKTALGKDLRILVFQRRAQQTRMTAVRDDAPKACCALSRCCALSWEQGCRPRFHRFFVLLVALRRASGSKSSPLFSETKKAASGFGAALKHESFEGRLRLPFGADRKRTSTSAKVPALCKRPMHRRFHRM